MITTAPIRMPSMPLTELRMRKCLSLIIYASGSIFLRLYDLQTIIPAVGSGDGCIRHSTRSLLANVLMEIAAAGIGRLISFVLS